MATYSFSATESIGVPEQITLTDESVSPDPGLTSRRVSFRLANGNWLTTNGESTTIAYETWPIADAQITYNLLSQSTSMEVTVEWLTGSSVTGTDTQDIGFVEFDYLFAYDLIGGQTSSPNIIQDSNYYSNFSAFIVNLFCAETAVEFDDIYSSQEALNRNQVMINNQQDFF